VSIQARVTGAATNGADALAEESGHLFQATNSTAFHYDDDGNLTSDARWSYGWDAENRLIAAERLASLVGSDVPLVRLESGYDSQNRRFKKAMFNGTGSSSSLSLVSQEGFIYDNQKIVVEVPIGETRRTSFVYGLDVGGTLEDAGGAGALLTSWSDSAPPSVYLYDGSGNAVGRVNVMSGTTPLPPEYGPFGDTLRASGPFPMAQKFGFATKEIDAETSLLNFGQRFYNPAIGRWLIKDPLGETGGLNPYAFVGNNALNTVDVGGLYGRDVHGYFTYFAGLAAGLTPGHAQSIGYYAFGPDLVIKLNAITGFFRNNPIMQLRVQRAYHALTGGNPENVRHMLESTMYDNPIMSDLDLGFFTHLYQDTYAHTVIRKVFYKAMLD
jgi:RHS repeat-associated protein